MICNRSRIVITQCNGPLKQLKSCRYASGGTAAPKEQDAFAEGEIESLYDQFPDRPGTREEALQYLQNRDRALLRDCESSITALSLRLSNVGEDLGEFSKPIEILPGHSFVAGELRYRGQAYNTGVKAPLESLGKAQEYMRDLQYKPYPDIRQARLNELEEFDLLDLHEKEKQIKDLKNREAGVSSRVNDSLREWTKAQSRNTESEIEPGKGRPGLDRGSNPYAELRVARRERAKKAAVLRSEAAQKMLNKGWKLRDAGKKIAADSRASIQEEEAKPAGWRTAANAVTKEAVKKRSGRSKTREDTSVKKPAENIEGDAAKARSSAQKNEAAAPADECAVPAPATDRLSTILRDCHKRVDKSIDAALRKQDQNLSMEERLLDVLSKELPNAENTKLQQYRDLAGHKKGGARNAIKLGMKWLAEDIMKTQDPETREALEERLATQVKLFTGMHRLDRYAGSVKRKAAAKAEAKAEEKGTGSEEEDTSPHPPVRKVGQHIPVFRKC